MSVYFLDSSALIKRYLTESGTAWLRGLIHPAAGNRVVIAQITPIEMVSGLARKLREASISIRTLQAAMLSIDRHVSREYVVVKLAVQVEQQAKDLLIAYPLRAYDALQLASALTGNQQLITAGLPGLMFVSGDKRLLGIASTEGLTTDDPNNYP